MDRVGRTGLDVHVSPPEQLLRQVFFNLRVDGSLYFDSHLHGDWGMAIGASAYIQFHCVASGVCWLTSATEQVRLSPGDIALCMRGQVHTLSHAPGVALATDQEYLQSLRQGAPLFREGALNNRLLCGHFAIADRDTVPFLAGLPDLVVVRQQRKSVEWASALRGLMESKKLENDENPVSNRLAEALMIRFLDGYFQQQSEQGELTGVIQDKRIARALSIFHRRYHEPLTVEQVAGSVGMSRSAFSILFKRNLQQGPMAYLNSWRFYQARQILRQSQRTLLQVSLEVGYASEAAFSRAFKRRYDITPGEYRLAAIEA
ncbi:AraC family transcriptional regulator [Hahella aquimaris]|uniref:AraC family transcriptional regulator n=1 Tax=Hahella sp. HNIBRBA332 TaxID=3015983 RepID=UPI00273AC02F|nr:AraC family transcriptional regulator [Hahella sp. HNIBRBA332]WLQ16316.1 AraC family transcriptional regulator [Hahella sp. HNIBRBA332]